MADRPNELPFWTPVPANAGYFSKPPLALVNNGYNDKEAPDPGIFNYQFHQIFKWVEYLDQDKVSKVSIDVSKEYVDIEVSKAKGYADNATSALRTELSTSISSATNIANSATSIANAAESAANDATSSVALLKKDLIFEPLAGESRVNVAISFSVQFPADLSRGNGVVFERRFRIKGMSDTTRYFSSYALNSSIQTVSKSAVSPTFLDVEGLLRGVANILHLNFIARASDGKLLSSTSAAISVVPDSQGKASPDIGTYFNRAVQLNPTSIAVANVVCELTAIQAFGVKRLLE